MAGAAVAFTGVAGSVGIDSAGRGSDTSAHETVQALVKAVLYDSGDNLRERLNVLAAEPRHQSSLASLMASPLYAAARTGRIDVCRALLQYRANPNIQDSGRGTALHAAAFAGKEDVVEVLLENRASANVLDAAGQTPLFFAPTRKICERLAAARADANVVNDTRQSALHLAAHAGLTEALDWMTSSGRVSPDLLNLADSARCTPADYAVWSRSKTTTRLLRQRGAKRSKVKSFRPVLVQQQAGTSQSALVGEKVMPAFVLDGFVPVPPAKPKNHSTSQAAPGGEKAMPALVIDGFVPTSPAKPKNEGASGLSSVSEGIVPVPPAKPKNTSASGPSAYRVARLGTSGGSSASSAPPSSSPLPMLPARPNGPSPSESQQRRPPTGVHWPLKRRQKATRAWSLDSVLEMEEEYENQYAGSRNQSSGSELSGRPCSASAVMSAALSASLLERLPNLKDSAKLPLPCISNADAGSEVCVSEIDLALEGVCSSEAISADVPLKHETAELARSQSPENNHFEDLFAQPANVSNPKTENHNVTAPVGLLHQVGADQGDELNTQACHAISNERGRCTTVALARLVIQFALRRAASTTREADAVDQDESVVEISDVGSSPGGGERQIQPAATPLEDGVDIGAQRIEVGAAGSCAVEGDQQMQTVVWAPFAHHAGTSEQQGDGQMQPASAAPSALAGGSEVFTQNSNARGKLVSDLLTLAAEDAISAMVSEVHITPGATPSHERDRLTDDACDHPRDAHVLETMKPVVAPEANPVERGLQMVPSDLNVHVATEPSESVDLMPTEANMQIAIEPRKDAEIERSALPQNGEDFGSNADVPTDDKVEIATSELNVQVMTESDKDAAEIESSTLLLNDEAHLSTGSLSLSLSLSQDDAICDAHDHKPATKTKRLSVSLAAGSDTTEAECSDAQTSPGAWPKTTSDESPARMHTDREDAEAQANMEIRPLSPASQQPLFVELPKRWPYYDSPSLIAPSQDTSIQVTSPPPSSHNEPVQDVVALLSHAVTDDLCAEALSRFAHLIPTPLCPAVAPPIDPHYVGTTGMQSQRSAEVEANVDIEHAIDYQQDNQIDDLVRQLSSDIQEVRDKACKAATFAIQNLRQQAVVSLSDHPTANCSSGADAAYATSEKAAFPAETTGSEDPLAEFGACVSKDFNVSNALEGTSMETPSPDELTGHEAFPATYDVCVERYTTKERKELLAASLVKDTDSNELTEPMPVTPAADAAQPSFANDSPTSSFEEAPVTDAMVSESSRVASCACGTNYDVVNQSDWLSECTSLAEAAEDAERAAVLCWEVSAAGVETNTGDHVGSGSAQKALVENVWQLANEEVASTELAANAHLDVDSPPEAALRSGRYSPDFIPTPSSHTLDCALEEAMTYPLLDLAGRYSPDWLSDVVDELIPAEISCESPDDGLTFKYADTSSQAASQARTGKFFIDAATSPEQTESAMVSVEDLVGWWINPEDGCNIAIEDSGRTLYDKRHFGSAHDLFSDATGSVSRFDGWSIDAQRSEVQKSLIWAKAGEEDVFWRRRELPPAVTACAEETAERKQFSEETADQKGASMDGVVAIEVAKVSEDKNVEAFPDVMNNVEKQVSDDNPDFSDGEVTCLESQGHSENIKREEPSVSKRPSFFRIPEDGVHDENAMRFAKRCSTQLSTNMQQRSLSKGAPETEGTSIDDDSTVWIYLGESGKPIDVRESPDINGKRTRKYLSPGDVFEVKQTTIQDGVTYLRLADDSGWLFDHKQDGRIMCVEVPKDFVKRHIQKANGMPIQSQPQQALEHVEEELQDRSMHDDSAKTVCVAGPWTLTDGQYLYHYEWQHDGGGVNFTGLQVGGEVIREGLIRNDTEIEWWIGKVFCNAILTSDQRRLKEGSFVTDNGEELGHFVGSTTFQPEGWDLSGYWAVSDSSFQFLYMLTHSPGDSTFAGFQIDLPGRKSAESAAPELPLRACRMSFPVGGDADGVSVEWEVGSVRCKAQVSDGGFRMLHGTYCRLDDGETLGHFEGARLLQKPVLDSDLHLSHQEDSMCQQADSPMMTQSIVTQREVPDICGSIGTATLAIGDPAVVQPCPDDLAVLLKLEGCWLNLADDCEVTVGKDGKTLYGNTYFGDAYDLGVQDGILFRWDGWVADLGNESEGLVIWTMDGEQDVTWRRKAMPFFTVDNGEVGDSVQSVGASVAEVCSIGIVETTGIAIESAQIDDFMEASTISLLPDFSASTSDTHGLPESSVEAEGVPAEPEDNPLLKLQNVEAPANSSREPVHDCTGESQALSPTSTHAAPAVIEEQIRAGESEQRPVSQELENESGSDRAASKSVACESERWDPNDVGENPDEEADEFDREFETHTIARFAAETALEAVNRPGHNWDSSLIDFSIASQSHTSVAAAVSAVQWIRGVREVTESPCKKCVNTDVGSPAVPHSLSCLFKDEVKKRFPMPNTSSYFSEAQAFLRSYGLERFFAEMKSDGFWDDVWNLQNCIFSKIVLGKIPQPEFQATEQNTLGEELGAKYMVAANASDLDAHWEDSSEAWRGRASMSKRHRFLLIRPCLERPCFMKDWFNILLFGVQTPKSEAVATLKEMRYAALKMTSACGWSDNVGLFFVIYGHTTCTSPLHIVDMDCVGPSYEALRFKLLKLDDALAALQSCPEVDASARSWQGPCSAESPSSPVPCSSGTCDVVEQQAEVKEALGEKVEDMSEEVQVRGPAAKSSKEEIASAKSQAAQFVAARVQAAILIFSVLQGVLGGRVETALTHHQTASSAQPGEAIDQQGREAVLPRDGHAYEQAFARFEKDARIKVAEEEEARIRGEEEASVKLKVEANVRADVEAKIKAKAYLQIEAEEEARANAEAEANAISVEQTRKQLQEEAQVKVEKEMWIRAEQELKANIVDKMKARAEKEAHVKVEEETKAKAEAETRLTCEEEANAKLKAAGEARTLAEANAKEMAAAGASAAAEREEHAKAEQKARAKAEAEATTKIDEEAKAKAKVEEDARVKSEEEAKSKVEEEARANAKEEAKAKAAEEARALSTEEAWAKAERLARARAETEERIRNDEIAIRILQAEEEVRAQAAAEAKSNATDMARALAEETLRGIVEQMAKAKAEEETRIKAEEEVTARISTEEEIRAKAGEDAKTRVADETRVRTQGQLRSRAEELAKATFEDEARLKAQETARMTAEEEAKKKAAEEEEVQSRVQEEQKSRGENQTNSSCGVGQLSKTIDPAIPVSFEDLEKALAVISPLGQSECCGVYELIRDEHVAYANGSPIWRKPSLTSRKHDLTDRYLYVGTNGQWIIGDGSAWDSNFACTDGYIQWPFEAQGVMPHDLLHQWERFSEDRWLPDASIMIVPQLNSSEAGSVLESLIVSSPKAQCECSGMYELVQGQQANGAPLWRKQVSDWVGDLGFSERWLYLGTNGQWLIGGASARQEQFLHASGYIRRQPSHVGDLPHALAGPWSHLSGDEWVTDSTIVVTQRPAPLHLARYPEAFVVSSPRGQSDYSGFYEIVLGEYVNSAPVWSKRDRVGCNDNDSCRWLHRTVSGLWLFGTSTGEVAAGCIRSAQNAQNNMPHELSDDWERLEGDRWVADSAITVTLPPILESEDPFGNAESVEIPESDYQDIAETRSPESEAASLLRESPSVDHGFAESPPKSPSPIMPPKSPSPIMQQSPLFTIRLERSGGPLGLKFKTPSNDAVAELLIVDILDEGALPEHNARMRFAGLEDLMVAPGMSVVAINGIKGDLHEMFRMLRAEDEVELVISRSSASRDIPTPSTIDLNPSRPSTTDINLSRPATTEPANDEKRVSESIVTTGNDSMQTSRGELPSGPDGSCPVSKQLHDNVLGMDTETRAPPKEEQVKRATQDVPHSLHVQTPNGQQECAGRYELVDGRLANGRPLWKKVGSEQRWIYYGSNSMWFVGDSSVSDANFEGTRGFIHWPMAEAPLPHELVGDWMRVAGHEWLTDPGIIFTRVEPAESAHK